MTKFKKGDIVKVVHEDSQCYGEIVIVNQDNDVVPCCLDVNGKYYTAFNEDFLELATGYDAIVKGTVLKLKDGNERQKVLGIVGDVYFVSCFNNYEDFNSGYTRKQIEEFFESPTPEPKGTPVYDKDGKCIGYMTDGKVITN